MFTRSPKGGETMEQQSGTDIMYQRLDEYEKNFRNLDAHEKAIFFYAYSIARVDAAHVLSDVDFTNPSRRPVIGD